MGGLNTLLLPFKGFTMKKFLATVSVFGMTAVSAFAGGAGITVPTPDYADFKAIVGVSLGVALIVMLARKGKSFISK